MWLIPLGALFIALGTVAGCSNPSPPIKTPVRIKTGGKIGTVVWRQPGSDYCDVRYVDDEGRVQKATLHEWEIESLPEAQE